MADLKVTFPEPCSEPWESMEQVGCNRHCASCDRIVHDLAAMTVDQAEALLDSGDRMCVLAEIAPDGRIKTRGPARAMVVGAGAMLLAACQTAPGGRVENGITLTGQTFVTSNPRGSTIRNAEGDSAILHIGQDGRFEVSGLRPGNYSLEIVDYCGASHSISDIAVAETDIDLGRLDIEPTCIIVGHVVREEPPRNV